MRAVIQRVKSASVTVDGEVISSIQRGLCILIGLGVNDTAFECDWMAKKILNLKLFPMNEGDSWGWNKTVQDAGGELLLVSQFTLYANTTGGAKPDFHRAMAGDQSKSLYLSFLETMRGKYHIDRIHDGRFGAMMDVALVNDGPVTIMLDSIDGPTPPTAEEQRLSAEKAEAKTAQKREQIALLKAKREAERLEKAALVEG